MLTRVIANLNWLMQLISCSESRYRTLIMFGTADQLHAILDALKLCTLAKVTRIPVRVKSLSRRGNLSRTRNVLANNSSIVRKSVHCVLLKLIQAVVSHVIGSS